MLAPLGKLVHFIIILTNNKMLGYGKREVYFSWLIQSVTFDKEKSFR